MEYRFALLGGRGTLTAEPEGPRVRCRAELSGAGRGLYKVHLAGKGGRFLLGSLIPEDGVLRLSRTVSLDQLERHGAWPPEGAGAELVFTPEEERPPPAGRRSGPPPACWGSRCWPGAPSGCGGSSCAGGRRGSPWPSPGGRGRSFPCPPSSASPGWSGWEGGPTRCSPSPAGAVRSCPPVNGRGRKKRETQGGFPQDDRFSHPPLSAGNAPPPPGETPMTAGGVRRCGTSRWSFFRKKDR